MERLPILRGRPPVGRRGRGAPERFYARENLCITDYGDSLRHDTRLVRDSPGTPRHVHVYGFLYDIDREELQLVVDDPPAGQGRTTQAAAAG